jgi:hypothetical protein
MSDDLEPLTEDERSSILDAVALLEAYSRGDRLAVAVLLHATDDAAYLRRVAGVLAYLVSHYQGVDDPNTLAHHPPKLHASGDTQ